MKSKALQRVARDYQRAHDCICAVLFTAKGTTLAYAEQCAKMILARLASQDPPLLLSSEDGGEAEAERRGYQKGMEDAAKILRLTPEEQEIAREAAQRSGYLRGLDAAIEAVSSFQTHNLVTKKKIIARIEAKKGGGQCG